MIQMSLIVAVWESYFKTLTTSKCSSNPQLMSSLQKLNVLEVEIYRTCDPILGDSITVEEVEGAIRHLKPMCSSGADSLTPEHLKHCGSIFKNWLCQLFNHLLRLEQIPTVFKHGVIIPVYKGKGKDPLSIKSFRGITVSSVISKTFEFVLLERIVPFLEDSSRPQLTQSAYRKNVSCVDSIFASHGAVRFFTAEGDHVYSSFYDLQCAFDTVEYCILLEELFNAGLKGKLWRIIKHWYTNPASCVRVCNKTSAHFSIGRGV